MKRKIFILLLMCLMTFVVNAKDKDTNMYEIEMAEIGQPGTLVVRAWIYNKKPIVPDYLFIDSAIKGVLFNGVNDSGRTKGRKALVFDGYDKHRDYFDNFFGGSEYKKYAKIAMNSCVGQNNLVKVGKLYKVAKIVVISYSDLRSRLENDKIINSLNDGF